VIRAVLVSAVDLAPQLQDTLLFRNNVERLTASTAAEVRRHAEQGGIDVALIDPALPGASSLVAALRQDPLTRPTAIVGLGRSAFSLSHLDLLQAGANAILPLPPGGDWDDRLMRLVHVPMRKATRLAVDLALDGGLRGGLRIAGRVLNLSIHGLLIECSEDLTVGDDLRFAFDLPSGQGRVCGTGTIVRLGRPQEYGLELTRVEGDGRAGIKRYVESGWD